MSTLLIVLGIVIACLFIIISFCTQDNALITGLKKGKKVRELNSEEEQEEIIEERRSES